MVDPPSNEHRSVRRRKPRDVRFYPLHDRLIRAEAQVQVHNDLLDIKANHFALHQKLQSPSFCRRVDRKCSIAPNARLQDQIPIAAVILPLRKVPIMEDELELLTLQPLIMD